MHLRTWTCLKIRGPPLKSGLRRWIKGPCPAAVAVINNSFERRNDCRCGRNGNVASADNRVLVVLALVSHSLMAEFSFGQPTNEGEKTDQETSASPKGKLGRGRRRRRRSMRRRRRRPGGHGAERPRRRRRSPKNRRYTKRPT